LLEEVVEVARVHGALTAVVSRDQIADHGVHGASAAGRGQDERCRLAQAGVNSGEAYFVGWLGPEALAGVSLVFPLMMLMQGMAGGGMGGGVASAVARALGAGRRDDANALALHAIVIACLMGALFTVGALWGGSTLYRAIGGAEHALEAALTYSNLVFAGALSCWLLNTLASIVRGTGTMLLPTSVVISGGLVTLSLSPALILGWGPLPRLGIAGAAVGFTGVSGLRYICQA
jgi:Na+-driven multidrug efflux pump